MHVVDSVVQFHSENIQQQRQEKEETLTIFKNGQAVNTTSNIPNNNGSPTVQAQDEQGLLQLSKRATRHHPVTAVAGTIPSEEDVMADLNIRILKALIERFTGKKISISSSGYDTQIREEPYQQGVKNGNSEVSLDEYGMVYNYHESYYEAEETTFFAKAQVITADGEELSFDIDLTMSNEFYSEQKIELRAGAALKDPLVINFGGTSAELTQTTFSFDIDADGNEEQIAFVKEGSGFLALDIDGNGEIDDGSELFGAITGNGFAELMAYDSDDNGWIDVKDSIYDRLRIWSKDGDGKDTLIALGQRRVGAIYLGNIDTPFSIKGQGNSLLGQIRSTGMFLSESGGGTVQQIDLVV